MTKSFKRVDFSGSSISLACMQIMQMWHQSPPPPKEKTLENKNQCRLESRFQFLFQKETGKTRKTREIKANLPGN